MGGAPTATGGGGGTGGSPGIFIPTDMVDMLFVIDDSSGMRLSQTNLERNLPVFFGALKALPRGLPDLRIAVISSDMGAGDGSISGCAGDGRGGRFQYAARGACIATTLEATATFIVHSHGVTNYTGDLADVMTCIAALGENGCGFEHPLAAISRALGADGRAPPAENQGFLRRDAFLFVVIVSNEDDCSAPSGSGLFDAAGDVASPLGPLGNFRCVEFGHLCNGSRPPRLAPTGSITDTVTLDGCVPAEGSGMLTPVATLVSQIRALKPFPSQQIVVSAIVGPSTPYQIEWQTPRPPDIAPRAHMSPSCVAADASVGLPAIRTGAFVDAFGGSGVRSSICDDSFAPALQEIANRIAERIAP
jgi:hypothetical protein